MCVCVCTVYVDALVCVHLCCVCECVVLCCVCACCAVLCVCVWGENKLPKNHHKEHANTLRIISQLIVCDICTQERILLTLSWLSITPLGFPVVPDCRHKQHKNAVTRKSPDHEAAHTSQTTTVPFMLLSDRETETK